MLKILANENVEGEEDRVQCQVDTVLVVKRYLESMCPTDGHMERHDTRGRFKKGVPNISEGIGSRQISDWLGEHNWSKSKVADLLTLHTNLAPEIVKELTWKVN